MLLREFFTQGNVIDLRIFVSEIELVTNISCAYQPGCIDRFIPPIYVDHSRTPSAGADSKLE